MDAKLTHLELKEKIERLEKSLEQSKAANKRIKAECRYIDYNKLRGRFYSKCTEVERLQGVIKTIAYECDELIADGYTEESGVVDIRNIAREALAWRNTTRK